MSEATYSDGAGEGHLEASGDCVGSATFQGDDDSGDEETRTSQDVVSEVEVELDMEDG